MWRPAPRPAANRALRPQDGAGTEVSSWAGGSHHPCLFLKSQPRKRLFVFPCNFSQ